MTVLGEIIKAWTDYFPTISDWEDLVKGIEPKDGGCGFVYELPNPIYRPNESFAIADMQELDISEPHYHTNGEMEIYYVLQGKGKMMVGDHMSRLEPGQTVVIPPDVVHITVPEKDLVLAVVNSPAFDLANYIALSEANSAVAKMIAKLQP